MAKIARRTLLAGSSAILGGYAAVKLSPKLPDAQSVRKLGLPDSHDILNDASLLSATPVKSHIKLRGENRSFVEQELRKHLAHARFNKTPVAIGRARHSMGAHSLPYKGKAISLENSWVEPDQANSTYTVGAGTTWQQVIATLDKIGYSPAVMQSNNDFGVASTFCVNAHGWPTTFGPNGATVRSVKMLNAEGDLLTLSRQENPELFRLSMGGYGLFGILTELELEMVPNQRLQPMFQPVNGRTLGLALERSLMRKKSISMAYGRLNVDRENFFNKGLLVTYLPTVDQSDLPAATGSGFISKTSRYLFRGQLANEPVKKMRTWVEAGLAPRVAGETTRNSLLNEPVVTLDDRDPTRTDILHEYFVSSDRFSEFVELCQKLIPASYQELLNITLRYVDTDPESVLTYAPAPRIAAVMLFSQEMSLRAEADMKRLTEELIEGVIAIGGTYYLPYRPHATLAQLKQAYPQAGQFVDAKRRYDPDLIFSNGFWDTYLSNIEA